ncbi:MAG: hypothetical protein D6741_12955 [Planctomycetota bacterium]|nr:MAG: hypothetical protein D6741_12955 [Planctomycetota bacterium]
MDSARRFFVAGLLVVVVAIAATGKVFAEHPHGRTIEPILQDLFLGESVYPQERGEWQVTTGFLWAEKREHDFEIPTLIEYGITDRLQFGVEVPTTFLRNGPDDYEGVGNIELDTYYNFWNDPCSRTAYGMGFTIGLPEATPHVGKDAVLYEPYFVAYGENDLFATNVYTAIEIEDPLDEHEDTTVGAQFDVACFTEIGSFVPLFELGVELEENGETPVRLAPGIYWKPEAWPETEFGVSLPIGLNEEAADLGVFVLLTWEFGTESSARRTRHGMLEGLK